MPATYDALVGIQCNVCGWIAENVTPRDAETIRLAHVRATVRG